MKRFTTFAFLVAALATVMVADAKAATMTIFDDTFVASEGYVNGGIGFGPANPDGIVGQGPYSIDVSGNGTLSNSSNAFVRALFGLSFGHDAMNPDPFTEATVNGLVPGDVIEIAALGLSMTASGTNLGVFGLSNMDGGNLLGGSSLGAGVQFTSNGQTIWLDRNTSFSPSLDVDTGVANGTAFDYVQRFVALGGGVFDIEHYVNGSLLTTSSGVTPDLSKSSTDAAGHIQDFGQAGTMSVDALSLKVITIPEPASFALFGLGACGLVGLRRRNG